MLTITRNRLLSKLSINLDEIDKEYKKFEEDYKNKLTDKQTFSNQLYYIVKKIVIVRNAAYNIPIKKGEVSNWIIASDASNFLDQVRGELFKLDPERNAHLGLVSKTNLKNFSERFKKCLKEHDAELIINQ